MIARLLRAVLAVCVCVACNKESKGTKAPTEDDAAASAIWPDLSAPIPSAGGGENDAAVIVGIEEYPFIAPVPGAIANAEDWYLYLTSVRNVPVPRVQLLRDQQATKEAIVQAVTTAAESVQAGGTVWFVFIGHGAPALSGKDGLLVGFDGQQTADSLEGRSARQTEILAALSAGDGQPIAIIDACFSGRGPDGEPLARGLQPVRVVDIPPPGSAVVITAAGSDEYAGALPGQDRPMFSYLVLGAIRGWGDLDRNGEVTAAEIVDYAGGTMTSLQPAMGRKQTPRLAGPRDAVVSRGTEEGPQLQKLVLASYDPKSRRGAGDAASRSGAPGKPVRATRRVTPKPATKSPAKAPASQVARSSKRARVHEAQIESLKGLIKESEGVEQADLLFRLAAEYESLARVQAEEGDAAKAEKSEERLRQTYDRLLREAKYKDYRRRDEVLYYYALALERAGKISAMRETYLELIRSHPQSRFIPHAYLSFADYQRENGNCDDAQRLYDRVVDSYRDSDVRSWGALGLARCAAKTDARRALDNYVLAIDSSKNGGAGNEARARALRSEARKAVPAVYAEVGKPAKAKAFFEKVGRGPGDEDEVKVMLKALYAHYLHKANKAASAQICAQLRSIDASSKCAL